MSTANGEGILSSASLPNILHIALVVPRTRLGVFTRERSNSIGTPGLHGSVYNGALFENSFYAIDLCFGKLARQKEGHVSVVEDPRGWYGTSDLIATWAAPSFPFLIEGQERTRVALVVNPSLSSAVLAQELGANLRVFDAGLDDGAALYLLRAPLGMSGESVNDPAPSCSLSLSTEPQDTSKCTVSAASDEVRLDLLTIREDYAGSHGAEPLSSGGRVSVSQAGPCSMTVSLGTFGRTLVFPYPIDGARSKTRIARKQLWIELIVPVSSMARAGGYSMNPFPVISHGPEITPWGMGRVDISQQAIIPRNTPLRELSGYLKMTLSKAEFQSREAQGASQSATSPLMQVKESVTILFLSVVGQNPSAGKTRCYGFRLAVESDSDLLLFVNSLCHDSSSGSVLLDAFVVPLTIARIESLMPELQRLARDKTHLTIAITREEEIMWKQMLPALVERCRVSWTHKSECEYGANAQNCPRSTLHGEPSICSCGEGKDSRSMPVQFKGFSSFATRIALSPISAVPYLEHMAVSTFASTPASIGSVPGSTYVPSCSNCGKQKADLKSCTRCGKASYCDQDCQKANWKAHKKTCKA